MSLYYEAASLLANSDCAGGSLKSRIYGKQGLKSSSAAIYALITEATKWSVVLKEVIERSGLLKEEKKVCTVLLSNYCARPANLSYSQLTPTLALLLTHDLLLSKKGVAAPVKHPLRIAINRHKGRLASELTLARIRRGFGTLETFRKSVDSGASAGDSTATRGSSSEEKEHPRWVRVNTLKTTTQEQLNSTFEAYKTVESLVELCAARPDAKCMRLDPHIPDLLALPPRADVSNTKAYLDGDIILQDKASCFPAYLLDVQPEDEDVIDGCAAPGNKTTHLAALIFGRNAPTKTNRSAASKPSSKRRQIIACERDKTRATVLEKMVARAGASSFTTIKPGQDFLRLDTNSADVQKVGAILLDPSCSGSGIIGRDYASALHLPSVESANNHTTTHVSQKRKRSQKQPVIATSTARDHDEYPRIDDGPIRDGPSDPPPPDASDPTDPAVRSRLESLSAFQLRLLTHALAFPSVTKISYSTCSVHFLENEAVVLRTLHSPIARSRGWRILGRDEQIAGMRTWNVRGDRASCEDFDVGNDGDGGVMTMQERRKVAEACLRCEKGTDEGTMGFFVAVFVRDEGNKDHGSNATTKLASKDDSMGVDEENGEEEWQGFSDEDENTVPDLSGDASNTNSSKYRSTSSKRKRKSKRSK
ncbi:S-adenosyl-L-methionine-dependent methyltransferase [Patellaria atrata CBS 101060]|uniref:S-adenosyl-L-methionine-dependent methyltransferase n=1 Tax=Patellaria atrata CBS 101060 TaxID=1346257 RepID=A0A9P4VW77_9PEZI|nr:S-adenosyl-L-methionine-dependent methyltransferase [Patellaria atrata CBS 101060]